MTVDPETTSATFDLDLKAGKYEMKATFKDEEEQEYSAYYVYISREK